MRTSTWTWTGKRSEQHQKQSLVRVSKAGAVALPYAGSCTQTLALTHSLTVRVRDVATTITPGEKPPLAHWEALKDLRERYSLPEIINTTDRTGRFREKPCRAVAERRMTGRPCRMSSRSPRVTRVRSGASGTRSASRAESACSTRSVSHPSGSAAGSARWPRRSNASRAVSLPGFLAAADWMRAAASLPIGVLLPMPAEESDRATVSIMAHRACGCGACRKMRQGRRTAHGKPPPAWRGCLAGPGRGARQGPRTRRSGRGCRTRRVRTSVGASGRRPCFPAGAWAG